MLVVVQLSSGGAGEVAEGGGVAVAAGEEEELQRHAHLHTIFRELLVGGACGREEGLSVCMCVCVCVCVCKRVYMCTCVHEDVSVL